MIVSFFRQIALNILVPIAIFLSIGWLSIFLINRTLFNAEFYKSNLARAGVYQQVNNNEILKWIGSQFDLQVAESAQQKIESSIDDFFAQIKNPHAKLTSVPLWLQGSGENKENTLRNLEHLRSFYGWSNRLQWGLGLFLPILWLVIIIFTIQQLVQTVKTVAWFTIMFSVMIFIGVTFADDMIADFFLKLIPDSLQWIDPQIVKTVVENMLRSLIHQIQLVTGVITGLAILILLILYMMRYSKQRTRKEKSTEVYVPQNGNTLPAQIYSDQKVSGSASNLVNTSQSVSSSVNNIAPKASSNNP